MNRFTSKSSGSDCDILICRITKIDADVWLHEVLTFEEGSLKPRKYEHYFDRYAEPEHIPHKFAGETDRDVLADINAFMPRLAQTAPGVVTVNYTRASLNKLFNSYAPVFEDTE